jgi:predicted nuclease with TOPRIM domain
VEEIKNYKFIKGERHLKAEEEYKDSNEIRSKNRYKEPIQGYEVLRTRLKTLEIHNSEIKMKRKNEIERIQDRINQLLDKPLSRNSLNQSLQRQGRNT